MAQTGKTFTKVGKNMEVVRSSVDGIWRAWVLLWDEELQDMRWVVVATGKKLAEAIALARPYASRIS